MKARHLIPALLMLAACAPTSKPAAVAEAPPPPSDGAMAPPAALVAPAPTPVADTATITAAQRDLKALGYATGKAGNAADPLFQRAILAFEKDQGLTEDGTVTAAFLEKLKLARTALAKSAANRNAVLVYSDGSARRQALPLLMPPPKGLVSDAPANFLAPLKPGSEASYHMGKRGKDGSFIAALTVTCHAGRLTQAAIALGSFDTIAVDCQAGGASSPLQWHSLYSPSLGGVVRQDSAAGTNDLVALRPFTGDWPSAARTGLDWALTHQLDSPPGAAVQWSSTGVAAHFDIKAGASLSGKDAGLTGKYAALFCRRFDMSQSGGVHYPGLACQDKTGAWSLPGSTAPLAAPANGIARAQPVQSAQLTH